MRGSISACTRSTRRLISTKKLANTSTVPCNTGREPGRQPGDLVGMREVPADQPVERRKAEKQISLAAIVWNSAGRRDVGRGHRDAEGLRNPGGSA
jgi:hypothetical protein